MRIAAIVLLTAALPALAQSPATFRSSAEVTPAGADALHVMELPFEAYRDSRKDLADIRIFNAAGDPVPFAWAPDPGPMTEPAVPVDLPIFPVRTVPLAGQAHAEVTVRAADGTLVSIRGLGKGKALTPGTAPRAAAWLLDATKTTEPVKSIAFDWQAAPGSELVTVRVEASDDLKSWSQVGTAPLVRLGSGDRTLLQPRVEFPARKVKYLRVTADQPAFEPTAVRAEYVPRGKPPARLVKTVEGARSEKPDEIVFDLGSRLPVEALRLLPQQDNAVMVGNLHARNEAAEPWRPMLSATFYRLQREGVESVPPPREIGRRAARYWMVRLAPGSSQGPLPRLEVHWAPTRVVFVKQGEGPFHLAFGNEQAAATALPIESVMPEYKRGKEDLLPVAKVGAVKAGPPPSRWEKLIGTMDARRVTLWSVLVLGVVALGFMAWRLSKQVK
jgi:hypothetical protein